MRWPFVLIALFCASVQFAVARHKALKDLELGRWIHADWLDYIDANPDADTSREGDRDWQQLWVENYDNVIRLLRLRDSLPSERHCEPR